MSTIRLGVNIDHAATLRQARYRDTHDVPQQMVEPDPIAIALAAEKAGADGITLHLREDKRHIQDIDVRRMSDAIKTTLNFEMACTPEMTDFAIGIKPDTACLVPENRLEITTEGGLDIVAEEKRVAKVLALLHQAEIPVSFFIDPNEDQVRKSAELGADMIELHTGAYANAYYGDMREHEYKRISDSLELGIKLGLTVNAGHGINYENVKQLVALDGFHEFNIGHSILSRAMLTGVEEAVSKMKGLMER